MVSQSSLAYRHWYTHALFLGSIFSTAASLWFWTVLLLLRPLINTYHQHSIHINCISIYICGSHIVTLLQDNRWLLSKWDLFWNLNNCTSKVIQEFEYMEDFTIHSAGGAIILRDQGRSIAHVETAWLQFLSYQEEVGTSAGTRFPSLQVLPCHYQAPSRSSCI